MARDGVGRRAARPRTTSRPIESSGYREAALQLLRERKAYPCYCSAEELDAKRKQAEREHRRPGLRSQVPRPAVPRRPCAARQIRRPQLHDSLSRSPLDGRDRRRRSRQGPRRVSEHRARRLDHRALRRLADLQLREHPRRRRHRHHAHRARRRPSAEHAAPDADGFFALGFTPPAYAHLPQVMGPDGSTLSKRHGATSVFAYREAGYFPEALLNYLARLGWSHGDQEIFSKHGADRLFRFRGLRQIGRAYSTPRNLLWLNFHYLKERPIAATRARGAARSSNSAGYRRFPATTRGSKKWSRRCTSAPRRWSSWSTSRRST